MSLEVLVQEALERRRDLIKTLEKTGTTAYRLMTPYEGIEGISLDRYGPVIVLNRYSGHCSLSIDEMKSMANLLPKFLSMKAVILKDFIADRSAENSLLHNAILFGNLDSEAIEIWENGMTFSVRPTQGHSTGFFIDQRENRDFIRNQAAGKVVLNGFAHTCSFSVAAVLGGAKKVVSVDISKKYLEWGREHFVLNKIPAAEHTFVVAGFMDYLCRAARKTEKQDVIIIDPPSFSRNRDGKVFSIRKDLNVLISRALEILNPQGLLFFSCNYEQWSQRDLEEHIRKAAGSNYNITKPTQIPPDFAPGPSPIKFVAIQPTALSK